MSVGLDVHIEEQEGKQVLHIGGRLDAANAPKLQVKLNELIKQGHEEIVLNFTKIEYLSSAGVRLLLSMTKKLSQSGGFKLCALHEDVMEIIKMAGFERILDIYPTEKEALDAF